MSSYKFTENVKILFSEMIKIYISFTHMAGLHVSLTFYLVNWGHKIPVQ